MALKSIYEIEIDDTQFKKFKELFDRYQKEVGKLPAEWKKLNEEIEGSSEIIDVMVHTSTEQEELDKDKEETAEKTNKIIGTTVNFWRSTSTYASATNKAIKDSTLSLAKWGTLTAAFSGLLGAGSLWGIDKLANSVAAQRRSALGLGISYGQQASFQTNYERLINPSSLLQSVSGAKYDVTSPAYTSLLAAGVSPNSLRDKNASQISEEFLARLPGLFAGMKDKGLIGAKAKALGIDNVLPMNDLVAYLSASDAERRDMAKRFGADSKDMAVTDEAQKKWADLTTQLDRASRRIEATFIDKLVAIEPGLEKLSDGFVTMVEAVAKGPLIDDLINGLGNGLNDLGDFVKSPKFQEDVEKLVAFVGTAADAIWKFISSFSTEAYAAPVAGSLTGSPPSNGPSLRGGPGRSPTGSASAGAPAFTGASPVPNFDAGQYPNTQAGHEAFIRAYAAHVGIDPNFATAVARAEGLGALGAGNPNSASVVDRNPDGSSFSFGDFQLNVRNGLGNEARVRGIDPANPNDWMKSDAYSLDYMADHGVGPWRSDKAVESYRSAGRLPQITVRKNTGANVVISNYGTANSSAPPQ